MTMTFLRSIISLLIGILVISCSTTKSAAVVHIPPIVKNLARGSFLKCAADLTGGLPLEVWKSSVVLQNIRCREEGEVPPSTFSALKQIINEQGVKSLWRGLSPRMVEGLLSGGVLLAAKESIHTILDNIAAPILSKSIGLNIPPSVIGFCAGAGGGAAQSLIMGPTSLLVTACIQKSDENISALKVAKQVIEEKGIRGLYRGTPAVAMRQASNWASRQGFTEFLRPRVGIDGPLGELAAGCLGGTLSAWNTPFECARIESQSKVMEDGGKGKSLIKTMSDIVSERGVGDLFVGLGPRACQACYQTVFLVCIPRMLPS